MLLSASHSQAKGVTGGEGHSLSTAAGGGGFGAVAAATAAPPAPCSLFGWFSWVASVLVCAAIMSASRLPESLTGRLFGAPQPGLACKTFDHFFFCYLLFSPLPLSCIAPQVVTRSTLRVPRQWLHVIPTHCRWIAGPTRLDSTG